MTETKTVYRISSPEEGRSVWYDRQGEFRPVMARVEDVPMPLDPFRLSLGGDWLSAVDDATLLEVWFPGLLEDLYGMGFRFQTFVAPEWRELPNEIVFNSATAMEVSA